MKNIAVIIPCYNEARTILQVIDDVHRAIPSAQIYVFDNNSIDNSRVLVEKKIEQITKIANGGGHKQI